jgi:hypothetical protein
MPGSGLAILSPPSSSAYRTKLEPGIAPPVVFQRCLADKRSCTVSGSPASTPPVLHRPPMRNYSTPCAYTSVSRSLSGTVQSSAPQQLRSGRPRQNGYPRGSPPSLRHFALRTPSPPLLLSGCSFFPSKKRFSLPSFYLSRAGFSICIVYQSATRNAWHRGRWERRNCRSLAGVLWVC